MSLQSFLSMGDGSGRMNEAQVNEAFRDQYGIDAPPQVLYDFANTGAENPQNFYQRVAKGDFVPDIQKRDPGFMQQSQIAQLGRQQIEMNKQAYAPLIPSLEKSKTSLQSRYDAILSDLTNRETKDTNNLTKSTSAEFAKRGIPLSSDAYTRELAGQLNPINSQYGTQRATQQAQLGTELNSIDQAIASLRAGKPDAAIPAGNSLFGAVDQSQRADETYRNISLPQSQASIQSNKYGDLTNLIKQFQGLG